MKMAKAADSLGKSGLKFMAGGALQLAGQGFVVESEVCLPKIIASLIGN